ncbi:MAG: hypothetical protein OXC63_10480 [Aestuariivita sp.]|nr:hypothetical protein [Aestuariivita sp.]MCY4346597.1 hypothetical protein [Aestuariivita sp.]
MTKLNLPINDRKTRCLRCPEEPFEFLGYRLGRNDRKPGTGSYIATRPSKARVQSLCRNVSEQTAAKYGGMDTQEMVTRLNRMIIGRANYYRLGQVSPADGAIKAHTTKRLRRWLCRKNKVKYGKYVRFSDDKPWNTYGLKRLAPMTKGFAWAKS